MNISNANDPKEGKILENIFNKNGLNIKLKMKKLITLINYKKALFNYGIFLIVYFVK